MREFFHGWRRTAGCVTLVMACMLFGVSMRSRFVFDVFWFVIRDRQHMIVSSDSQLSWRSWNLFNNRGQDRWTTYNDMAVILFLQDIQPSFDASYTSDELDRDPSLTGPNKNLLFTRDPGIARSSVQYWTLILPITVLSAYLILWKPRKRSANKTDELTTTNRV